MLVGWQSLEVISTLRTDGVVQKKYHLMDVIELSKFRDEGFTVVPKHEPLVATFENQHVTQAAVQKSTVGSAMNFIFNHQVVSFLATIANARLKIRQSNFNPTKKRVYLFSEVTDDEILWTIAISTLCENVTSLENSDLKKKWNVLKHEKKLVLPFGKERYKAIRESLVPSKEELVQFIEILNLRFKEVIDLTKVVHLCVDETIFDFEPRMTERQRGDTEKEIRNLKKQSAKGDDGWSKWKEEKVGLAPIVHIPDKPHDGLFVTGLATKSSKTNIPFLISLVPYIGTEQKLFDTLQGFLGLFQPQQKVHFILDARFASFDLFETVTSLYPNVLLTMSMKCNSHFCFKILKQTTKFKSWKAVVNKKGFLMSLQKLKSEEDGRNYLVLTNAFLPQSVASKSVDPWTSDALDTLASLPIECLSLLCKKIGVEPSRNITSMIDILTGANDFGRGSYNPKVPAVSNHAPSGYLQPLGPNPAPGYFPQPGYYPHGPYPSPGFFPQPSPSVGPAVQHPGAPRAQPPPVVIPPAQPSPVATPPAAQPAAPDPPAAQPDPLVVAPTVAPRSTPRYSAHLIEGFKVDQLKEILKAEGLSTTGKKAVLQKRAKLYFDPSTEEIAVNQKLWKQLLDADKEGATPQGELYRKHFNCEDLGNRLWYRIDKSAKIITKIWTSKFLWSCIRVAQGNAFWLYSEFQDGKELVEFRDEWARGQLPKQKPKRKAPKRKASTEAEAPKAKRSKVTEKASDNNDQAMVEDNAPN